MLTRLWSRIRGWFTRQAIPSVTSEPSVFSIVRTQNGVRQEHPQGSDERRAKQVWANLKAKRVPGYAEFYKNGVCRGTYEGPAS